MKNSNLSIYDDDYLKSKIYIIRGVQVMLDADLAEIYGYTTKRFNEQVKNNIERFDDDFRFQLDVTEYKNLKSKFSTSSWGGARKRPYAFTELGIYSLMTVLKGDLAVDQSKKLIKLFKKEYPNVDITLQTTGGIYHDRYIFIDSGTKNEMIFHCGGSSKDGGRRVSSITKVEDVMLYRNIIGTLNSKLF
ncbi:MAG: ORF6N domain-containing protein [Bacteroidales bacterium]|nr:ORF6N domain-containing protein [Bacteroidales bacterium]